MTSTKIEWTDAVWNPIRGCTRVSEGCRNCYAERIAARFSGPGEAFEGIAENKLVRIEPPPARGKHFRREPRWTGKVALIEEKLSEPLHWKKPRRVFVNSMSDLFHEKVAPWWIEKCFDVMARCPQHTFQILTKRPWYMREYFDKNVIDIGATVDSHPELTRKQLRVGIGTTCNWPLPNVWLGVSVEDQATADERIPLLLQTPAAIRFISAEPLLGHLDLNFIGPLGSTFSVLKCRACQGKADLHTCIDHDQLLDWVICGGESGPGARPVHVDWVRSLRDQCEMSGVPFFFKQWGEWLPNCCAGADGKLHLPVANDIIARRVGKKAAGRLLDGREYNDSPIRFTKASSAKSNSKARLSGANSERMVTK